MAGRLMDDVRRILRLHHYSYETEKAYCQWIRRFILHHGKRHPRTMGDVEIKAYLSHLAVTHRVAASTQNQALSALLFLYKKVLLVDLPWMDEIVRAKRPVHIPVVLTRSEVSRVLDALHGQQWLIASLLYGSGLRLIECLSLRIKDLDFEYLQLSIRAGKGSKDRHTMLAEKLIPHLKRQFEFVRSIFEQDRAAGMPGVSIPFAIDKKYKNSPTEWKWQYVFPSKRCAFIHFHKERRRHHLHPSSVQRAMKTAVRKAGIDKLATCHTLRHYLPFLTMSGNVKNSTNMFGNCRLRYAEMLRVPDIVLPVRDR